MTRWRTVAAIAVATVTGAMFSAPSAQAATAGAAPPAAVFGACGPTAGPGARCGTVTVPLDRARPSAGSIPIAFQLYPHTDATRPSVSTIVMSNGGPGISSTWEGAFWQARLQPLLATHDLLAIDHRGTGLSAAIDCPGLQHVQGDPAAAARACGAHLGAAADRYGSGDVADDIDAVRAALGIDKIDYYGDSYGSVDVRAYAYRFPQHLRSAILDSPDYSADEAFSRTLPTAMARITELVCERSPACSAGTRDPAGTLDWLVQRLRDHPVRGTGYDADGTPHTLVVDESGLLGILYNEYFADPAFLNQGEIFAAATALRHGDATALLRLAAESPSPTDFGDPAESMSVGDDYAVFCSDSDFPWDKQAPEATREAQYQAALKALPRNATEPFSPSAWTGFIASQPVLLIPGADACVPWPAPTRPDPPFPANARFPSNVPALLFGGGLDYLDVRKEQTLMPLFPSGKFITVANAGHVTTDWSPCAQAIALRFLQTLHTGDTSCAGDTLAPMASQFGSATGTLQIQGVSAFPTRAAQAPTPDRTHADRATPAERRVAGVAWSAVEDAVYQVPRMTGATGRGLHGGTYTVSRSGTGLDVDYQAVRFSTDVTVTGHATLDSTDNRLTATVDVAGPGGTSGTLTMTASLWEPDAPNASVRGTLDHHTVALLAPAR